MKLDKETLNKHRFWILLGAMVPLVLLALIWLNTFVASANAKLRRDVKDLKSKLDQNSQVKESRKEMEALDQKIVNLKEKQAEVWKDAWNIQQDLMEWPKDQKHLNKLYFGDRLEAKVKLTGKSVESLKAAG